MIERPLYLEVLATVRYGVGAELTALMFCSSVAVPLFYAPPLPTEGSAHQSPLRKPSFSVYFVWSGDQVWVEKCSLVAILACFAAHFCTFSGL